MAKPPKKKYVSKTQGTRLDDGTYVTPIAEVKGYKTPANAVREGRGKFAKGLYSGANLATEVMGTPLALALETLSGRGDYKSALPNVDRSNKMFGLPYDKNNLPQNEQLSPSTALGIDNPYMSVPIDLATDLLTGKLATSGKSIGKNLIKNKIPKQLQSVNQAGFANLFGLGKPKQAFQSEIDWGKWNPETPNYPELINEYNAIEESTKKAGTWMKNPNGSEFKGTPEQFIQQQSSHFKKAFPEGFDQTTRGTSHFFNTQKLDEPLFTSDIRSAVHYTATENPGFWNVNKHKINQPTKTEYPLKSQSKEELELIKEAGKTGDYSKVIQHYNNKALNSNEGGLYQLYSPKSKNSFTIDAKGKEWTNIPYEGREMPTDFVAEDLFNKNLDYINIENVRDPALGNLKIINPNRINTKSAIGNVGFFDMTNPNIYKGLVPGAVATGAALSQLPQEEKALGGKITNMKKKKFKLGGITDPPKTYSWSSGKKPGKTAQIQNTQNSSISKTTPSIIKNTIYEGKLLPEAEVVASKIVKNPIDIFTNPIDTFTNPYRNQPLGNQPFPFTYTDDTMIDDGYGYGHNNMWMSKTLDIDGYKKSNKTDGTSVTGHINDIMENYDELKTINPTLYLIKKNLSLPNEKQYSGKYADDALGDYFNNEKNYINKNIIPKGYTYRSINDDNSLIQSFTPNKDTLLGNITLTPEMWKDIYNSKSDKEAKQKLFKMANVSEEEQKNFDNTFIHMNLNNPKKLAQYKKIKSKLENINWDASIDKPTAYIKANGGKITNNMKKKKNNLPKYDNGTGAIGATAVKNISNSGGGGFGQQLLGKVGGEIFKNIPGASNIASDPLGSLVGLTTNSVIDMVKAIEEKERERRPILKNINSVMAMGGKVDDMFNYLYEDILTNNLNSYASGGTIKIKPSKKGTFTKAAKSRGMGVQEFASKVLANKDNYSSAMVKKANFARNASKWKHDMGGYVDPQNVPVEVEGEEMYEMPNGQVGEFSGPKHENGGIPIELPEGTKIYSDRLTINGKTMAERKDKREKNISKLERLLSKNPQDKFIKSALQREKETFQQEEQQDMMVQEQMNNAQQQTEQAMMQMMMPQTTMGYGGMLMANGGYIDPTDPPTNSPTTIKLDPNQAYRVPQLDTEGELTFRNVSYNEKGEPVITDKRIPKYAEYMSPSSHYANQYAEYINQGLYNLKDEERYQRIMQDLTTRYPSQGRDVLFKVADFYNKQGQFSNKKGEFVEGSPVESFGVLNTLYGADAGKYYEQQVANMRKQVEGNLFGKPLKWAPGSINPDNMVIKNETEELANGGMIKRADGSYSKRGLWDNIRANRGSGKKPTKQMLAQEKKIRAEEKAMGGYIYGNGGKLPTEILKARLESHMSPEEANDYLDEYGKGGYVVRRSNDRKGKTHVVIGPDGTKKYFGDPKMGEKGKSKHGKEAFYARHKHNLKNNPYFRAYARATWGLGGTIPTYENGTPPYGVTMTDENYLQRSDEALLKNNFDITNPDNSLMKNIGYPFQLNVEQSSLPYNQPLINFDLSTLPSTPYNASLLENIPSVDYDFSKSDKEKSDKEKPGRETKKNKLMEALQKAFLEATGNKEGFTEGDLKGMQGTEMGKTLPSLMTLLNRLETPKNINFFRDFGQDALRAAQEAQGLASTNKYQQLRDLKLQENAARQRGRGSARGVNTLRALDLASDMLGQQGMEQVYNNYAQQMMSLLGQKSQLENVQDQMVMQGEQNRDLADRQDIDAFYTNLAENMATASEFTQKQGRDLNVAQYNKDILSLAKSYSRYGIEVVRNPKTNVLELVYNDKVISKEEAEKIKKEADKK